MRLAGCLLLLSSSMVSMTQEPASAGGSSAKPSIRIGPAVTQGERNAGLSRAVEEAISRGYLPARPAAYERAKAAAADEPPTGQATASLAAVSPMPTTKRAWRGLEDANHSPSDSTGAIGPTRYIEVVNSIVGVYDRSGGVVASADLATWWNVLDTFPFDPQVIWDPGTSRFYYTGVTYFSDTGWDLTVGWSTTDSPAMADADWCRYVINYGSELPDNPHLGDSAPFILIGVNAFNGETFRGADIIAIGKPDAATTCPDASALNFKIGSTIRVGSKRAFSPVPANQTDDKKTGWIVTVPVGSPAASLGLFNVTENADGSPDIQTSGGKIKVPIYTIPPNAPQKGSTYRLDTLDARLAQAVSAVDPAHGKRVGLWTQHTVAGGAGAMVRWYEVDPARGSLLQTGIVRDPSLFVFNGAISPDRMIDGATKAFGGSMILGYNTSSRSTYPTIWMIGKRGAHRRSAPVKVKSSPGPDIDSFCPQLVNYCRWGDYAGATPDPKANPSGKTGSVWLTSMWTKDGNTTGGTGGISWQTWNWQAKP
jgi:hypothetical protein